MENERIENSSDKFWPLDGDNIQSLQVDRVEREVEFYKIYSYDTAVK